MRHDGPVQGSTVNPPLIHTDRGCDVHACQHLLPGCAGGLWFSGEGPGFGKYPPEFSGVLGPQPSTCFHVG